MFVIEHRQVTPQEARKLALQILATAEAAEADAMVFKLFLDVTKNDEQMAAGMLTRFRKLREELDALRALNGERNADDA